MFKRFVAGSAVGALVSAVAALALAFVAGSSFPRTWPLTTMWCFVPLAWGIWAAITPRAWLPEHLPYWGAVLGLLGGTMSAFVLNLPSRVFEVPVSIAVRSVMVVAVTVLYYLLWMLVRAAYQSLAPTQQDMQSSVGGPQLKKAA